MCLPPIPVWYSRISDRALPTLLFVFAFLETLLHRVLTYPGSCLLDWASFTSRITDRGVNLYPLNIVAIPNRHRCHSIDPKLFIVSRRLLLEIGLKLAIGPGGHLLDAVAVSQCTFHQSVYQSVKSGSLHCEVT